jgi:hypothetical protein
MISRWVAAPIAAENAIETRKAGRNGQWCKACSS